MFTEKEKEILKNLVEKELKGFEKEESTIRPEELNILEGEEKYDEFLKQLMEKLK